MYNAQLFLGFPANKDFNLALQKVNPAVLAMFIQDNESYLSEITWEGSRYIGKYLDHVADLQTLELLEANIYSLLKKLVPDFPCRQIPLCLFPVLQT